MADVEGASGRHRLAWSGSCRECGAVYVLFASEERSADEQNEISTTWPTEGGCMVENCDGTVEWNGNDRIQDVLAPRML